MRLLKLVSRSQTLTRKSLSPVLMATRETIWIKWENESKIYNSSDTESCISVPMHTSTEIVMARRRTTNEMEDEEKLIENEEDFEVASKTSSASSTSSSSVSIKVTASDLEEESKSHHHLRVKEEKHLIRIPLSFKHRLDTLKSARGKRVYWWVTVASLCVLVILALSIPLGLWENRPKQKCLDFEDVPEEEYEEFPFLLDGVIGDSANFELCQRGETKLTATLGLNHRFIQEVKVDFYNFSRSTLLNVTRANKNCLRVEWVGTSTADAPLKDCYQIGNEFWYAGYETYTQKWPINLDSSYYLPLTPFLPHDYLFEGLANFGPVLHPLWLSSNGSAIVVDRDVQLFVSIDNDTKQICLHARPFELDCLPQASSKAVLNYTVCVFENIANVAKYILNASGLIEHPKNIPDAEVFRKPIWSTWAKYKTNINDSALQKFYNEIVDHNFGISQLEIDDGYSVHYGELKFNSTNFSPQNLSTLASKVNLTAWVHPFINSGADVFHDAVQEDYFLPGYSETEGNSVSLVKWWHDYGAVINFLNSNVSHWHGARLEKFLSEYSLKSLKFDAGEYTYLPKCVYIKGNNHPADFTVAYAQFVGNRSYSSRAEVRVGYFTQEQPMFVRMLDRTSTWGLDNGLQSVLTTALAFGIAGYPFVLPDMIGGNGGNGTATSPSDTTLPDLELYVRWVQLNAFLPVMQFSIAPWQFNASVVENAHKMVNLHMNLSSVIIDLAREACQTSHPIIRPLWWIVTDADPKIWTIYDQFLIGDDIMVAPILEKAKTTRQVYFPHGTWWKVELPENENQCKPPNLCGDGDTKNFVVSLWDTLYFSRVY